jgi:hypothetical protein
MNASLGQAIYHIAHGSVPPGKPAIILPLPNSPGLLRYLPVDTTKRAYSSSMLFKQFGPVDSFSLEYDQRDSLGSGYVIEGISVNHE